MASAEVEGWEFTKPNGERDRLTNFFGDVGTKDGGPQGFLVEKLNPGVNMNKLRLAQKLRIK